MKKILIILIVLGFAFIVLGVIIEIADMMIDHQCYQLEPNEFYQSTICERYWKYEEER